MKPTILRERVHRKRAKDTHADNKRPDGQAGHEVPLPETRGVFLPVVELLSAAHELLLGGCLPRAVGGAVHPLLCHGSFWESEPEVPDESLAPRVFGSGTSASTRPFLFFCWQHVERCGQTCCCACFVKSFDVVAGKILKMHPDSIWSKVTSFWLF